MNSEDLKKRFKKFAINAALLIKELPTDAINIPYSNQLIRSSSSPGANYRAACRAKSTADFINKLKIVEEELDESIYFLELLRYFNSKFDVQIQTLEEEGDELLAIIVKSIKTIKDKNPKS
ncbi:MAG: four helix bundle protein [Saprospiraceae bacterium]|nr:four helix bundle protein [Saprospiraceae bacterium]